jgi:hypothetical protein
VPQAQVPLLAAPDDSTANTPLAMERAVQIQKFLIARGVPAARLGKPATTAAPAVQLRIDGGASP